ncbi:class I SAM-dependent methyltransferase [Nostoc sp. CMAA1605]|uniref:class I SAM-dependent methyltransferase n=1 Tax=Nostoc sp. CMAA1605 TaxID=2055159 RepID=UPI001F1F5D16|nr:class I SAM-dependent methyltransferase [Nostoc sp. CMAA1605]MCF4967337.1 hypothetical protein [Nostoc sp. CMAA1605]
MDYAKVLERMKEVYWQSSRTDNPKNQHNSQTAIDTGALNDNLDIKTNKNYIQINSNYSVEIDGNYLLFFNDIYTNIFSKILKKILKKIAWPILKRQVYFNSVIRQVIYNLIHKNHEQSLMTGELNDKIVELEKKIDQLSQLQQGIGKTSIEMQADNIITNNFASTEEAKIKSGLWFNEPIIVGYRETGEAFWAGTNERILERVFVLQSLSRLYDSNEVKILDVGSAESLISYELATLNYSVTAIDIRPTALFHPNLQFIKSDICKPVIPPASFDCVIALSTLEHIGLGWYGDEQGESYDIEAVKQINLLLKPEGKFILTVPYGKKAVTPVHRIYDKASLQTLTQDFTVMQTSYGLRKDDFTWVITENELEASVQEHNPENYLPGAVAMLVCKKNKF